MKSTLLDPELKFQIKHSYQNIVDVDKETSSDSEDEKDDENKVSPEVGPDGFANLDKKNSKVRAKEEAKAKLKARYGLKTLANQAPTTTVKPNDNEM